jgi:hypothetical protein
VQKVVTQLQQQPAVGAHQDRGCTFSMRSGHVWSICAGRDLFRGQISILAIATLVRRLVVSEIQVFDKQ